MTQPKYVTMQLTTDFRSRLQRAQLTLSAKVGAKLTMSTLALAALDIAEQHPDEFAALLAERAKDQ